jgi:hypothetical protein
MKYIFEKFSVIKYQGRLGVHLISIFIVEYMYLCVGIAILLIHGLFKFRNLIVYDAIKEYVQIIISVKLIVLFLIKEVNENTAINKPYFKTRTLNQNAKFSTRICENKKIYRSFVEAIELFVNEKIKVKSIENFKLKDKPIKVISLNTHKVFIKNILGKYIDDKKEIEDLLQVDIDKEGKKIKGNRFKEKTIEYVDSDEHVKKILFQIKFLEQKILIEKCLLVHKPFKYLEKNFKRLNVDNYKVIIRIIE